MSLPTPRHVPVVSYPLRRSGWLRPAGLAALVLSGLTVSLPAVAEDFEEGGKLYAVQNRKYVAGHEFLIGLGADGRLLQGHHRHVRLHVSLR